MVSGDGKRNDDLLAREKTSTDDACLPAAASSLRNRSTLHPVWKRNKVVRVECVSVNGHTPQCLG
jgi:hypothetical protein